MIRFLAKGGALLAAITLAFALYIKAFPENFSAGSQGLLAAQMEFLERDEKERVEPVSVLVLGDSTMAAALVDPDPTNDRDIRSLAMPSATMIEACYQFEKYLKGHVPPRAIMVGGLDHLDRYRRLFWQLYVNFGFYEPAELDRIDDDCVSLGDFPMLPPEEVEDSRIPLPASWRFGLRRRCFEYGFFGGYLDEIQAQLYRGEKRRHMNRPVHLQVRNDSGLLGMPARATADPRSRPTTRDLGGLPTTEFLDREYRPSATLDAHLRQLLESARERHCLVYWVTTPISPRLLREQPSAEGWLAAHAAHQRSILAEFPNTLFLDVPLADADPDRDFFDGLHLSRSGAERWCLGLRAASAPRLATWIETGR